MSNTFGHIRVFRIGRLTEADTHSYFFGGTYKTYNILSLTNNLLTYTTDKLINA